MRNTNPFVMQGMIVPTTVVFAEGLDTRNTADVVITHNLGREIQIIDCIFLNTLENQALGLENRVCTNPVITYQNNNSFALNGYNPHGFKLRYK